MDQKTARTAGLNDSARAVVIAAGPTGSEKRLAAAEARLIKRAQPMIARFCRRYRGPDVDQQDLEAEARIALWHAARTWDPTRLRSFEAWAGIHMRGACQKAIRHARLVRGVHHQRIARPRLAGETQDNFFDRYVSQAIRVSFRAVSG